MRFATAACNFSTSEQTKVLRSRHVLYILTFKCAFRHSGVQFLTGLLFDWPDTRIIEKTQHFATSLTFGADVSSFFWLSDSCIFCRLTWWLYCWAMHLLFNCPYCRKFLFKLPSIIYGHWNLLIVYVLIHLKHGPPGIFPQWLGNFKMSRWRKRLKILCIRGNWNLQFFKISALSLSLSLSRSFKDKCCNVCAPCWQFAYQHRNSTTAMMWMMSSMFSVNVLMVGHGKTGSLSLQAKLWQSFSPMPR